MREIVDFCVKEELLLMADEVLYLQELVYA